jgi:formate hydrogenlyase subunit 6/NADH:ubiquinone oxidoreductase subunit I
MGKPDGFVDRPTHSITWFENGKTTVRDTSTTGSDISLSEKFTVPNYKDPSQTHWGELFFDYDKCNGCESCAHICPASAIEMKDKKPVMPAEGGCMACGDCMAICPKEAIRMKSSYQFSEHFKTINSGDLKLPRLK